MKYDVLIIGTGLSGSACARLLAQSGRSVLAIDRVDLSHKDKLCGGLMTPRAVKVFERLYGKNVQKVYSSQHTKMNVIVADRSNLLEDVTVMGTWRKDLDTFACTKAVDAGVEIWDCTRVKELDIVNGKAVLLHREDSHEIEFDVLIAADGASSNTRRLACTQYEHLVRSTKITHSASKHLLYEPRFTHPIAAEIIPSIEAYVNPSGAPLSGMCDTSVHGYGWYIPCGKGAVIGIDGAAGTSRQQLDEALESFACKMKVNLDGSIARGAFLPSGGTILLQLGGPGSSAFAQQIWPHPTYFLGDAAGLASPATGEGIYYALRSAEMLAKSLLTEVASYRSLMSGEASILQRQYMATPFLYNQNILDHFVTLADKTGIGPEKMARPFLKIFASF